MAVRVGVNGFGRIGRMFLRAAKTRGADLDFVAVNDITDTATLAHLLKFDSVYGRFPGSVEETDNGFRVDGDEIQVLSERDPASLPWKDLGVDVVVESTGLFTQRDQAAGHLEGGARKVIISAPGKEEDLTVVLGTNEGDYDPESHDVISIGSCTTNCVVPMAKIMNDALGIELGFMTTVHSYTNDQALQDGPHKDLRRARAAALSIIPTSTGAARAAAKPLPRLEGRLDGLALRVPTPVGSITDLVLTVSRETSVDEVNEAFRNAANGDLEGIVAYSEDPLVSADIVGDPHSCVFDSMSTMVNGPMVKILGWYDNEWGFSNRMADMAKLVGDRLP